MDITNIFERFCIITNLDNEEAERYRPLCLDAMEYVEHFAKKGAVSSLLDNLAACCANLCYSMLLDVDWYSSFKAGDMSYRRDKPSDLARELYNDAIVKAGHLLNGTFIIREAV